MQKDYNEQVVPKINYWDEAGHVVSINLPKDQVEKYKDKTDNYMLGTNL